MAYKSKRPVRDMEQTIGIAKKDFKVRCFVNLVNFNALWGHRRDPVEYGHELERFDEKLDVMLHEIKDDDFLIITTDHGNDPTYTGLYTRKGVVLTYYSKSMLNSGPLEKADTFLISEPQSQTISASECLNMGALGWQNSIDCVRIDLEKGRNHMVQIIFILISFLASVIGCICGIGGGVIIKPVMDAFGLYSVSTISFMSGCIVLSMTAYSFLKAQLAHESMIKKGVSTYLGIGRPDRKTAL